MIVCYDGFHLSQIVVVLLKDYRRIGRIQPRRGSVDSNNSPPPLIVTMTSLGYMAPRSKETWYFPEVYGIIAKTGQCLSMRFNSLPYLHV